MKIRLIPLKDRSINSLKREFEMLEFLQNASYKDDSNKYHVIHELKKRGWNYNISMDYVEIFRQAYGLTMITWKKSQ